MMLIAFLFSPAKKTFGIAKKSDCIFVFSSQKNFWHCKNMVEIALDTNLGFSLQIAAFSTTNRGFLWITIDVFLKKIVKTI